MRYCQVMMSAVALLLCSVLAAAAEDGCTNPNALGVSRVQEVDTHGGVQVGDLQYSHSLNFLGDKEVVLTFDDGPFPSTTPEILATLAEQCTKATFFYVGKMALAYPDILEQVDKAGHTIAAHTWAHANLRKLTPGRASAEIEKGVAMLEARLGHPIAPFFRFPYLSDPKIDIKYLLDRDFGVFSTDVDSWDSHGLTPSDHIVKYVMTRLKEKGHGIVLMHDIKHTTAHALPEILKQLKDGGYKIVHVVAKAPAAPLPIYADWAKKMIDRNDLANAAVASNSKRKPKIEEIPFDVAEAGTPATPEGDKPKKGKAKLVVAAASLPAHPLGLENGLTLPENRGNQVLTIATPTVVAALASAQPPEVLPKPVVRVEPKLAAPAPVVVAALTPPPAPIVPPKPVENAAPKPPASVIVAAVTPPLAPVVPPKPDEKVAPRPAAPAPDIVAAVTPPLAPIAPLRPVAKVPPRPAAPAPILVAAVTPPLAPVVPPKPDEKVAPKPAAPALIIVATVAPPLAPMVPPTPAEKVAPQPAAPARAIVAAVTPPLASVVPPTPAEKVAPQPAAPAQAIVAVVTPPLAPVVPPTPVEKVAAKPAAPAPVSVAAVAPPLAPVVPPKPVAKVAPKPVAPAPVVAAAVTKPSTPIVPPKPVETIEPKPPSPAPVVVAALTPPPAAITPPKVVEKGVPKSTASAPVGVVSPTPVAPPKSAGNTEPKPAAPAPVVVAAASPPPAAIVPPRVVEKVAPKAAAQTPVIVVSSAPAPVVAAIQNPLAAPATAGAVEAPSKAASVAAGNDLADSAALAKRARKLRPAVTRLATAAAPVDSSVTVIKPKPVLAEFNPPANNPLPVKVAPTRRPLQPTSDAPVQQEAAPQAAKPPKHVTVVSLDIPPRKPKALRPLKTVPSWVAINDTPQPGTSHNSSRN